MDLDIIKRTLNTNGWSGVSGTRDNLVRLARAFGTPARARAAAPLAQTLKPKRQVDAPRYSMSATVGLGTMPFHCDTAHWTTPARYVVLHAAIADEHCATRLISVDALCFSAAERAALRSAVFVVTTGHTAFAATIVPAHGNFFRFDPGCMRPATTDGARLVPLIERRAAEARPITIGWSEGMTVIIDNWRCLHARDAASGSPRELLRVLVT